MMFVFALGLWALVAIHSAHKEDPDQGMIGN
jgi:hypothetical protein